MNQTRSKNNMYDCDPSSDSKPQRRSPITVARFSLRPTSPALESERRGVDHAHEAENAQ